MAFVMAMAGHVDHGKSALIKALTGITTARYREEIEREITIDIGFAHLNIEGIGQVSIIDVPGHEDYVHNMLAGIFGARLALLVIAANEGIMPQTVEHFEILKHCGVEKIIAVINKSDLVSEYDLQYRKMEIEEFFKGTKFENSKIVFFSSITKAGAGSLIEAIKNEISRLLSVKRTIPAAFESTVYPVDRVFEKSGFGQILTGTLIKGRVAVEDTLFITSGGECRIRAIESHASKYSEISAVARVALNITRTKDCEIKRGAFLVSPEICTAYKVLTVRLILSTCLKREIKSGAGIKFYFYSACYSGRLRLLESAKISAGEECFAQIVLDEAQFALIFKAFIIRAHTDDETIGGGVIIDCSNELIKNKKSIVADASDYKDALYSSENELVKKRFLNFSDKNYYMEIDEACAIFKAVKTRIIETISGFFPAEKYVLIKERFISTEDFILKAGLRILKAMKNRMQTDALISGFLKIDILNSLQCCQKNESAAIFYAYVIDLLVSCEKLSFAGGVFKIASGGMPEKSLDGDSEIICRKILRIFDSAGIIPQTLDAARASVAKNQAQQFNRVVKFLESEKSIYKIFEQYYISEFQRLEYMRIINEILSQKPSFDVGDFKEKTGLSRKYAIGILEYFDRVLTTKRNGNERILY